MAISMPFNHGYGSQAASSTVSGTLTTAPTENNLLYAFVWHTNAAAVTSITGWTVINEGTRAGITTTALQRIAVNGDSATVTANTGTAGPCRISMHECAGNIAGSSVVDVHNKNSGTTTLGPVNAGVAALTTTQAGDLIVAGIGWGGTATATATDQSSNALTLLDTDTRLGDTAFIAGAAGSYNVAFSWTPTRAYASVIVAFKAQSMTSRGGIFAAL